MRLFWGYGSLFVCALFIMAHGNSEDDDWIDPYDMLNYDASSKSMKKPAEASSYSNVPTKRREYSPSCSQAPQCPDIAECTSKVDRLQREIEEHKRRVTFSSQKPTCNPVFRRFLSKLLREISKLGLPTDMNPDIHYDAEVKLSKQMVAEINKLLNEDSSWRTGALDDALSQILVNFKLHDYEAWTWRFEDTFSVELDTVIRVFLLILLIVGIICTEMWSTVSWFVQFKRMFAICFFISIVWNWFYLYKVAFAEHQAKIVNMETVNEKCTGVKKIDWKDNLREWFRTTWTLQDDPCKQYYEVLIVNPILLVPPTKAITITITTFITDPLKQFGQGISEFLRALLKDLPVTLQIPVLLTIVLAILVFMYGSAQAAIQHVVFRPLRGGRHDPPPAVQQPHAPPLRGADREEEEDHWEGGDADRDRPPRQLADQEHNRVNRMGNRANDENRRPEIRQRRPNRPKEERQRVYVETLRNADSLYSGDETDTLQGAAAEVLAPQPTADEPQADVAKEENVKAADNSTELEHSQPAAGGQSSERTNVDNTTLGDNQRNDVDASATVLDPCHNEEYVETVGTPVQETIQ
ncbi:chloride channel CLIC-like protein 1 [Salminus brasiliensis]|uniref:chloride channel CLIC-like protein 1 n=1 Tax=Salminus brasiliensis TaxID=930266 RepID=UPI003B839351